jgi:hypothetical protein
MMVSISLCIIGENVASGTWGCSISDDGAEDGVKFNEKLPWACYFSHNTREERRKR